MRVVSQSVLAIEHDETVGVDWTLTLQRLQVEPADVPNDPSRAGQAVDVLMIRTRSGETGGGPVSDVSVEIDALGTTHPVSLGENLFGVIGTVRHDRYSSTHVSVETGGGEARECRVISDPDHAVDFFVCLANERPVSLHADISGMDYSYPVRWPA